MTRCVECGMPADTLDAVLVTPDGDFCCSEECAEKYRLEREDFFDNIIADEERFENWMKG